MELSERLSWRGREVAWTRVGDGPPVVLCHGTPWSSWLWRRVAEDLRRDFTVHLWDMPGYGRSSKDPDHVVDLRTQGELFADLLEEWGLSGPGAPAPHVVAHDYGGAVTLRAHLLHGAEMASICLVDVVALRPWGSPFFRLVRDNEPVFQALPAAMHRGLLTAYVQGASHRGLDEESLAALVAPWTGEEGQAAFYRQIGQADERYTAEFEPLLGRVRAPVHVVWGTEDTWIPVDRAHRLAGVIPGATLSLVEGAGHLIQLDAPEQLLAKVREWLGAALTGAFGG